MIAVVGIAVAAMVGLQGQTRARAFPGTRSTLISPDGRWVLRNQDSDTEPNHVLFVRRLPSGSELQLMTYGRSVEALWAPSGSSLAINDHEGSDLTVCNVFSLNDGVKRADLLPLVEKQLQGDPQFETSTHVKIEAIAWRGPQVVVIRVSGYGDRAPNGFKRMFEYSIAANTLTKK